MSYKYFDQDYDNFLAHAEIKQGDMKYGLPERKAYPMPDRKHVLSAIKFFNYVSPKDEEELAKAILARMEEYGISEVNVGPDNRFGKYYEKTSLKHYQIKGAKHGVRRWQNPDGSWTPAGRLKYGKGGAPRGPYKGDGKIVPLGRGRVAGKGRPRLYGADFDGDKTVRIKTPNIAGRGSASTQSDISDARTALEKGPDAYNSKKEYLEAITKDCLFDPANLKDHEDDPEMRKRVLDAADLGLKAVENLRGPGYVDLDDDTDPASNREWFLFEDQTIGMPMVADLINQGYTSKEVKKLIDELDENYDHDIAKGGETALSNAMFQVRNGDDLKDFADECEKAKEKSNAATNEGERALNTRFNKNTIGISVPEIESLTTSQIEDKIFGEKQLPDRKEWPKHSAAQSIRALMYQTEDLMKTLHSKDRSDDLVDLTSNSEQQARKELTSVFIYDAKTREAMREAKEHGFMSLSEPQKDLLREVAFYDTPANRRLKRNQEKLEAAREKQNSSKYLKNVEQKQDLERRLDKLHSKTQRIRDNKLFRDKDPGLFDRIRLNKEARLEKKLSNVNKKIDRVDNSVDRLTKKQDKYQQKADRQYKYDARTREAMREARENGYDSLTEEQRKLLREVANSNT